MPAKLEEGVTHCCSLVFKSPLGFMSPEERKMFEDIRSPHLKYWIPVVWFSNLASKARQEGRIQDNVDLQSILNVTPLVYDLCDNMNIDEEKHREAKIFPTNQDFYFGGLLTHLFAVSAGDEPVQDVLCDSVRLRLGRRPSGVHAGLSHIPNMFRCLCSSTNHIRAHLPSLL